MMREMRSPGASLKVARIALLVLVALIPLFTTRLIGIAPLTHDTWVLPKLAFAWALLAVAIIAWAWGLLRDGGSIRWHPAMLLLGGAVLWMAGATFFSPADPAISLLGEHARGDGLVPFAAYAVLAFISLQVLTTGAALKMLTRATVVSGLLVSLFALVQWLGGDPFFYFATSEFEGGRAFATFGNPVFLGGYLAMLLPLAVGMVIAEDDLVWRATGWGSTGALTAALLATYSRGAWVAAFVGMALFAFLAWQTGVRPARTNVLMLAGSAVGGVLIAWAATFREGIPSLLGRLTSVGNLSGGSAGERLLIWRGTLDAISARPLFGFGLGRLREAFQLHRPAEHAERYASSLVDQAHNTPLQLAATAGVAAAVAWIGFVAWTLVAGIRLVTAGVPSQGTEACGAERGNAGRVRCAALTAAVAAYLTYCLTALLTPAVDVTFYMFVGVLLAPGARRWHLREPAMKALASALAATAVVLAVWGAVIVLADHSYLVSRMRFRGDSVGDPVPPAATAVRLVPSDPYYRLGLAYAYLVPGPHVSRERALEVLDETIVREPASAAAYLEKAALQAGAGEIGQARETLAQAQRIAPMNRLVRSSQAQLATSGME